MGVPRGPLFDFGRLWCGGTPADLPIPTSPETGLKIHFSASSHLDGNVLPLWKGNNAEVLPYLRLEFAGNGTRSELQPFWYPAAPPPWWYLGVLGLGNVPDLLRTDTPEPFFMFAPAMKNPGDEKGASLPWAPFRSREAGLRLRPFPSAGDAPSASDLKRRFWHSARGPQEQRYQPIDVQGV